MQSDMFPNEIVGLKQTRLVPKSSPLSVLNPYINENGLIRIRGRLRRACLPEATKNPIVLRTYPLLVLIIQHHHLRTLHAGSQLTLASLRQEFWIHRARATVRSVLYKCIPCTRERADVPVELMDDLPAARVNRTLAPLSIPASITQVRSLFARLAVEGINYKRHISLYSYASQPKLFT